MYFHTDSGSALFFIESVARLAAVNNQSLSIDVNDKGELRIKRGDSAWSAPIGSTPDPNREGANCDA